MSTWHADRLSKLPPYLFVEIDRQKAQAVAAGRDVIDLGIGDANLDLSKLTIDDIKVDFGIGEVMIELPATGEFDIDVDGGIGSIMIKVPEGMAVRLHADLAIVGRDIPTSYSRNDNVYTSPGYSDAENRANITLGLGIGSVSIREISN